MDGKLILVDGAEFAGELIVGKQTNTAPVCGEVVFNTGMTGYQEILTDPSYCRQIITLTYPLIGNYGANMDFNQSRQSFASGLVIGELCERGSNWREEFSLRSFLFHQHVPCLMGVDTRALTRHLRGEGTMSGVLVPASVRYSDVEALLARPLPRNVVSIATTPTAYTVGSGALHIAVMDFGLKQNLLDSLTARGCRLTVFPAYTKAADLLAVNPDGIFLTNGPGDPADLPEIVATVRELIAAGKPMFGICLGHQLLALALGAQTYKLKFGHRGSNQPVKDLIGGRSYITSQNHGYAVKADTLPAAVEATHTSLNDGTIEGLRHLSLPIFSVQFHPEASPGPGDTAHLFDKFVALIEGREAVRLAPHTEKSATLKKVLVIGSGPIVIGQAAEFDYAGSQACRALKEEGLEVVLVNSNPATIQTDTHMADRVYMEPLTAEFLEAIIEKERPDGLLASMGGQAGLNLAVELAEQGVLKKYGVRLLGTSLTAIKKSEDRELFKETMQKIGEPVPESTIAEDVEGALEFARQIGYPLIVRPAYTLGGTGGGIVASDEELIDTVLKGLKYSLIGQVLIERSVAGWKEIEYEVMRDACDNCITVCNMENLDPVGVHTGDSIVVAPSQTLSDHDYQMLRDASLRIIRELGIEGGCNAQFALDPNSDAYYVIEVNPRVSRSSALASKATGYPIAKVAAKVAVGYSLDEITNAVTGKTTAMFEPALDYCVVKFPRWPFDKFVYADHTLGTQMKATGETMSIDRSFEGALLKAVRSLEIGADGLALPRMADWDDARLRKALPVPTDERIFAIAEALRRGMGVDEAHELTKIDRWFLRKIDGMKDWRPGAGVAYKQVDTCAAEFEATTPYYYSTHAKASEVVASERRKVLVLGSGPIRIGQGVEFDYCTVQAVWALRKHGVEAVIINNNPETVSTDFDISDRLYFEPLRTEEVMAVIKAECPDYATNDNFGVLVQFGGQTAINLAASLKAQGVKILGTSVDDIDRAEDRERFDEVLTATQIPRPQGASVTSVGEAVQGAAGIGYPVMVRPSYVLGGRAMEIVYNESELREYMSRAVHVTPDHPVLVDRYMEGTEVEVDAISDGVDVCIPGIMEHVERAGVHSGDSIAVYPSRTLPPKVVNTIEDYTKRLALELHVKGLINVQYVVVGREVYIIEANPRSSRTVPFLSKVTDVPMVELATRVALGETLRGMGCTLGLMLPKAYHAIKAPVFSFAKMQDVDISLGPEMKSTGETMGLDYHYSRALYKALVGAGLRIPKDGTILFTVADKDKGEAQDLARSFARLGFKLVATEGTANALRGVGLDVKVVGKVHQRSADIIQLIKAGKINLVINTLTPGRHYERDGFKIRRATVEHGVPCLTSLDTATEVLHVLTFMRERRLVYVLALQDYIGGKQLD